MSDPLADGPPRFIADSFKKSFGGPPVLMAATCWAKPGTITALVGRNGSGKTTLLRAGLGLLRAENGFVRWEGEPVRPRLHRLARLGLFYLPPAGLLSRRLRVRHQLAAVRERFGDGAHIAARDPLGIAPFAGRRTHEISAGERRRVELTLALLRDPRCLLADEPMHGLAPKHQEICAAELRALASKGCAVLVTGHEVDVLFRLADDVIWIVAGGTYGLGSPAEALEHRQFRREYLGAG